MDVEVEMVMDNMAVISKGLEGQVRVVTTDLVPAIDGQLLKIVKDEEMMKRIVAMKAEG